MRLAEVNWTRGLSRLYLLAVVGWFAFILVWVPIEEGEKWYAIARMTDDSARQSEILTHVSFAAQWRELWRDPVGTTGILLLPPIVGHGILLGILATVRWLLRGFRGGKRWRVLPTPLALVWNVYQDTDPLKQAMDRIIDRYIDPRWPAAVFGDWRAALDRTPLFEHRGSRSFEHPHRLPANDLATLLLTSADVASLPSEVRRAFAREIDALAATLPSEAVIRAVTRVELYRRR
jgi:hypothetical protein